MDIVLSTSDEKNQGDNKHLSSEGPAKGVGQFSVVTTYCGTLLLTQGNNYLDLPSSPPQSGLHLHVSLDNNFIEIKAINQYKDYFIPVVGKGCCERNIFIFKNALGRYSINGGWLFIRATGELVIEGKNIGHIEFDYEIANGAALYQFYGFDQ